MKKEFGKWLMDIAKYIVTAVVLYTVFNDMQEKSSVIIIGGTSAILALSWGLLLVRKSDKKPRKRK
jgi:hypothetical protein